MNCKISDRLSLELKGLPASARVKTSGADGIGIAEIELNEPCSRFSAECWIPQNDIQFRWVSAAGKIGEGYPQFLPPSWYSKMTAELCRHAPVFSFVGANGENRLTAAVSESKFPVEFHAGICEDSFLAECRIVFSGLPQSSRIQIRFDMRDIPFSDSLRDVSAWWEVTPGHVPMQVPASAFEPVYSTWYSYHQSVAAEAVEREVELGLEYGIKTVIVDDGWQEIGSSGSYASAGEWNAADRFPEMKEHVRRVQAKGVRYLLWVALPFVGENSPLFHRMKEKLLYFSKGLNTWIVDPRFPEIRAFLLERCLGLVRNFNLDGLKIDFLDRFPLPSEISDPALSDGFAGRDCKGVDEAVDVLLKELCGKLRAYKPDLLIEFRQDYISPAMRKYANIFRASDCPGDRISNHRRVINLRLLSGNTAVHSDMLGWHPGESVESSARQLWNIVFSVPQISVRLSELSAEHRRMLQFYLSFWRKYRELFIHGKLTPLHPELNYPLVIAENASAAAVVLYSERNAVKWIEGKKEFLVINASASEEIFVEAEAVRNAEILDCLGRTLERIELRPGIQKIRIPSSGCLRSIAIR